MYIPLLSANVFHIEKKKLKRGYVLKEKLKDKKNKEKGQKK